MRVDCENLSPLAIIVGLLVSQALSAIFAFALVIAFLIVYGNKVMVAFFDYGSSIALTLALGLLATAGGGYASAMLPRKALINAILVGVITLAVNIGLWAWSDYIYAMDFRWMLALSALLTIPAAGLGGWLGLKQFGEDR